jgi:hypothetical protein
LLLWLGFLVWFFQRIRIAFSKGFWAVPRKLTWCLCAIGFGTAWLGTGMLVSIPGAVLLMIGIGWVVLPAEVPEAIPRQRLTKDLQQAGITYAALR